MELTIVTSNAKKAEQIGFFLGIPIKTEALEITEIQSLDILAVLEAKAKAAYEKLQVPLIVDDVSLALDELKGLPGPLVRWFLDTIGPEGLCRLADQTQTRAATATVGIGYIDASGFKPFTGSKRGKLPITRLETEALGGTLCLYKRGLSSRERRLLRLSTSMPAFVKSPSMR